MKNKEKTWLEILNELRAKNPQEVVFYASALRGPDIECLESAVVKTVFTSPLRGKGAGFGWEDASHFLELPLTVIERTFEFVGKHKRDYEHYLNHIKFAWYALGRQDIALIIAGIWGEHEKESAKKYAEKVKDWLESEEAFQPKGGEE